LVLARLLAPAEYGLMTMATVVITFASIFREMGTTAALIQKRELSERTTAAVFWFNVLTGISVAAIIAAVTPLIARGFRTEALTTVIWALVPVFPIASLASAHQALLERESRFKVLARIEVSSAVVSLIVAIVLALNGAGVYSLVAQTLTTAVLSTTQLWLASRWRPRVRVAWSELGAVLGFSSNLVGFNLVNFFARNADSMIIGRYIGSAALGTYSLAYKLMLFPTQNLTFVVGRSMFPIMSRQQDDRARNAALYRRSVGAIAMITAPMMSGAFMLSEPLVNIVFGAQWAGAGGVLAWLAPVGFLQSIGSTTGTVFMAHGKTATLMRLGIFCAVLQVAAFIAGVPYGVEGVAACYFLAHLVIVPLCLLFALRELDGELRLLLQRLVGPLVSSAIMCLALWVLHATAPLFAAGIVGFTMSCVGGAAVYALAQHWLFHQRVSDLLRLVRAS
ncbi:MAG: lipopolysaccharide biosynthesis protein, partial [Betaproteobacteria bacterium]